LTDAISLIVGAILTVVTFVINAIGVVDVWLGHVMTSAGIDPHRQLLVLLVVSVILVVFALRALGGILGWLVLILLVLLLLHRVLPQAVFHHTGVPPALQNSI
jgi:hypothetical protein